MSIALTTDLATFLGKRFMAITAHFIDEKAILHECVLECHCTARTSLIHLLLLLLLLLLFLLLL